MEEATPARTLGKGWRKRGLGLTSRLPEDLIERQTIQLRGRPPWNTNRKFEAIEMIDSMVTYLVVLNDGSATAGCKKGGLAAVIITEDAIYPETIYVIRKRANHTSSIIMWGGVAITGRRTTTMD